MLSSTLNLKIADAGPGFIFLNPSSKFSQYQIQISISLKPAQAKNGRLTSIISLIHPFMTETPSSRTPFLSIWLINSRLFF